MPSSRVWDRLSGTLAASIGDDFARKIGPLLRLIWPNVIETTHRRYWDAAGIDYFEWVDDGPFPCVVQCKGFEVRELGSSQRDQMLASIQSFGESGHSCDEYVLVHNRDSRDEPIRKSVDGALAELVKNGIAKRVIHFDRRGFLAAVNASITKRLQDALRLSAANRARRLAGIFERTSSEYLLSVPATCGTIRLRPLQPLETTIERSGRYPLTSAILSEHPRTWTLLDGRFGIGKTTATLVASDASDKTIVIVPCAEIDVGPMRSLRQLMEAAIPRLEIDDSDANDADRETIRELAGATLVALLSGATSKNDFVLVFDGLDENRMFATADGLTRLVNQLVPITCPVVLTTRTEHFDTLFGNYSAALGALSQRLGEKTVISWWRLEAWEPSDAIAAIQKTIDFLKLGAENPLHELLATLRDGSFQSLVGDIPTNPLMLRFLIDDVIDGELVRCTIGSLLASWVRKKLWRDIQRHGGLLNEVRDAGALVEDMCMLMERAARRMVVKTESGFQLTEHVAGEDIQELAAPVCGAQTDAVLGVALNSMLVPVDARKGREISLGFALRIFHEFFLASALIRDGEPSDDFPESVRRLHADLASTSSAK